MIHKFQRIVKRLITRDSLPLPRKANKVNPVAQKNQPARSILVNWGLGNTLVMEVA